MLRTHSDRHGQHERSHWLLKQRSTERPESDPSGLWMPLLDEQSGRAGQADASNVTCTTCVQDVPHAACGNGHKPGCANARSTALCGACLEANVR